MGKLVNAVALIVLGSALAYNWYFTYDYVYVDIDKGTIRGFNSTTSEGARFCAFKGIPYARPPIGELRFKGPEEETSWAGVRDAVSHGSVCAHLDIATKFLRGEEDCLFLNVYTPSLQGNERMPVMFWIHGGGFILGSANDELYGPDYFMKSGIVLVTTNYRLGALGFLSTGDDGAPGNAGLKDQVAALRWVRRNIAKFGGDPDNVTIFGESAGGVSTHYHLLSPMSKGLFTKAIGQSGSAFNLWSQAENGTEATIRLAEALGAENFGDATKALEFLKTLPYGEIVKIQNTLRTPAEERLRIPFLFSPTVEKGVRSEQVFLPDTPLKILKSGNFNKVPYITGYNSHEGYLFWRETGKSEVLNGAYEDTERFVPRDIKDEKFRMDVAKSIRKFYFDDKPIGNENITNFVHLYTDTTFVTGMNRATKLQLKLSNSPIYFYVFSYDGGLNLLKWFFGINLPGAAHGDELGYLFYHKLLFWKKPAIDSEDEHVSNTMIRLWTNFAKYGNPTPAGDPLNWQPVTNEKFHYLHISGRDTKLEENPDPERADFWTKAYDKHDSLQTQ